MALSAEQDALRSSLSCCTYRGDMHTHVLIEEHDILAKLKKVTLIAPNGDWFSFDPDKGRGRNALISPLLATGKMHDHHRACDCVVLVRRAGRLIALYIDLKSEAPKGYAGQFKSTRQFVRYALGLLAEFHGYSGPRPPAPPARRSRSPPSRAPRSSSRSRPAPARCRPRPSRWARAARPP